MITVKQSQRALSISSKKVEELVSFLLKRYRISCDKIDVFLVGKKKISQVHAYFFDDPTPTDCITLPHDPPFSIPCNFLGEIYICPAVAKEYAQERGEDPYLETTLYVIHCLLHMLGYDDIDPKKRKKMREEEAKCLTAAKKAGVALKGKSFNS